MSFSFIRNKKLKIKFGNKNKRKDFWKHVFIKVTRSHWTSNPLSANPTKWSTPCNNSSVDADELFECVSSFCGIGAQRIKILEWSIFLDETCIGSPSEVFCDIDFPKYLAKFTRKHLFLSLFFNKKLQAGGKAFSIFKTFKNAPRKRFKVYHP